jgi:hypothetical protein
MHAFVNHLTPGVSGRTIGLIAVSFILFAGSAFAQGQRQRLSPEEQQARFEKQSQEMIVALELTDEQTPMFMEIMEAANADRNDLIEDIQNGGDRSTARARMTKLNDTTNEALAGVLTDDQMKKYTQILDERREQARGSRSGSN